MLHGCDHTTYIHFKQKNYCKLDNYRVAKCRHGLVDMTEENRGDFSRVSPLLLFLF